jgi:hypothetical protein
VGFGAMMGGSSYFIAPGLGIAYRGEKQGSGIFSQMTFGGKYEKLPELFSSTLTAGASLSSFPPR